MRGCTLDIPGEVLEQAGFSRDDPPPYYRLWASRVRKGAVGIQLYREAS